MNYRPCLHPALHAERVLAHVGEITRHIHAGKPLQWIVQTAIAQLRLNLASDRVVLYPNAAGGGTSALACEALNSGWEPSLDTLIATPSLLARLLHDAQHDRITHIPHVAAERATAPWTASLMRLQVQTLLAVPIPRVGQDWGFLLVHHCHRPHAWSALEMEYVQHVAQHIGLAMPVVELHQADVLPPLDTSSGISSPVSFAPSASDRQLQLMTNAAPALIWMSDEDGLCNFFNQSWLNFTGRPLDQELGNGWAEGVYAEDLDRCLEIYQTAFQARQPFTVDYRLRRADGTYRWILNQGVPRFQDNGEFAGFIGSSVDIHDRKQSELLLQQDKRIISATPDCISLLDRHYIYRVVNQTYLDWNQKSYDQIVGHSVSDLLGEDFFRHRCKAALDRCLAGDLTQVVEGWIDYPDGQRRYTRATYTPYVEADDTISGVVINVHNLTALKQAELILRDSEQKYRRLVENMQAGLVVHSADTQVLQCTTTACDLLGLSMDQLLGKVAIDPAWHFLREDGTVMPPEDYPINVVLATQAPLKNYVVGIHRPNQTQVWVLVTAFPECDQTDRLTRVVVTFVDITDQKQAELALEQELLWSKTLFETSIDGIVLLNHQGDVLQSSTSFAAMAGYSLEEMSTLNVADWDIQWNREELQEIMTGTVLPPRFETQHRRKDGSVYDVEISYNREVINGEIFHFCICRDISDRKAAEVALRDSEARYRSVIAAMAEGVVLQQSDGTIMACNASAEAILGLTPDQMMGKTAVDLNWHTIQEDGTPFPKDCQPATVTLQTGLPQANVIMGICKSADTPTWISINSQPLFRVDQLLPYAVVVSFADITQLKQAELALTWQAEQRFLLMTMAQRIRQTLDLAQILQTTVTEVRQFLHVDRVVIYRLNSDYCGVVVAESVAPGWRSILGEVVVIPPLVEDHASPDAQLNSRADSNIADSDLAISVQHWLQQLEVQAQLIVPILSEHKSWGWLVAHHCRSPRLWQPLEIELQQQLATQLAIAIQQANLYQQVQTLNLNLETQVQERTIQLEQALHFETLLKTITEQVRDSLDEAVILKKIVEELAFALQVHCCDITRYSTDQTAATVICEHSQTGFVTKDTAFLIAESSDPHLYEQLLQGQTCHFCLIDQNVIRPEQSRPTILASPIRDDQGILGDLWLFKSAQDVFSEQEIRLVQQLTNQCAIALRQARLYQAAQAQVQELERLNKLKDDFLNTVSHELRTPMASIKMATQMIEISLQQMGTLDDQASPIQQYFKVLHDEEQREITLINDLLDLARLDAGTELLEFSTTQLQVYLPYLAEPFSVRAAQQQQEFVFQLPADLPPIKTDLKFLERILTELFQNACKYTPMGETITVSAHATADVFMIEVSNSGVEISPQEYDRIFDKFYRIPNNDPWKHGGTGLGLALVKKLAEQLNGQVTAHSHDQVTSIVLTLPTGFSTAS